MLKIYKKPFKTMQSILKRGTAEMLCAMLLFLTTSFYSCRKENPVEAQLLNTKWKLTGFVDAIADTIKIAEPDSEMCYLLSFNKDQTLSGVGCANTLHGNYEINYVTSKVSITITNITKINHLFDETKYIEFLNIVQSFSLQENKLKLHYNDNKNYLLFKKQQ